MRLILVTIAISAAFAQPAQFEVASVKQSQITPLGGHIPLSGPVAESVGFGGGPGGNTPGRIHYSGVSLKMILVRAYAMRPYQISGPAWLETERYEIDAKYPPETKPEEFRLMLQNLLSERFHLAVHRETKAMSRYRLIVAKGGPKLSPPLEYKDDAERKAAWQQHVEAQMEAVRRGPRSVPSNGFTRLNSTMAELVETLSRHLDRPVTDDTGLEGSYSYSLEWSPGESTPENALPSIFTALQQQLGLKLEPEKGPLEFLVIERAEKTPAPN